MEEEECPELVGTGMVQELNLLEVYLGSGCFEPWGSIIWNLMVIRDDNGSVM